jgi:Fur family ferric uptake transcriptional regulator
MYKETKEILRQNHLTVTSARVHILELFTRKDNALSHSDIEKKLSRIPKIPGRVTIYRVLQAFIKKRILICIPTIDSSIVYVLRKDDASDLPASDRYIHFICDDCHKAYYLKRLDISFAEIAGELTVIRADLVLRGQCGNCKASHKKVKNHTR